VARVLEKKLHVVSNGGYFKHLIKHNFFLPGQKGRWCTRVLKTEPQDAFCSDEDTVAIGIRVDEPNRLKEPRHPYTVTKPLQEAELDKQAVRDLCASRDLLNPCYEWRDRTGCWCCQFQRIGEWQGLLERHPQLFALAEAWEEESFLRAEIAGVPGYGFIRQDLRLSDLRRRTEGRQRLFCPTCGGSE